MSTAEIIPQVVENQVEAQGISPQLGAVAVQERPTTSQGVPYIESNMHIEAPTAGQVARGEVPMQETVVPAYEPEKGFRRTRRVLAVLGKLAGRQ